MTKNTKEYYVYVYLDQRKPGVFNYGEYTLYYEPFYVGKGKDYRYKEHLNEHKQKRCRNTHKKNIIRKIKRLTGKNPIIIFKAKNIPEKKAIELEIKMIANIGRSDLNKGPLANKTDGGEGMSGHKPSQKTRLLMSKNNVMTNPKYKGMFAGEKNPMFGRSQTESQKEKSRKKHEKYEWTFDDQKGNIFKTKSLNNFCNTHDGFNRSSVWWSFKNKRDYYKQWKITKRTV